MEKQTIQGKDIRKGPGRKGDKRIGKGVTIKMKKKLKQRISRKVVLPKNMGILLILRTLLIAP